MSQHHSRRSRTRRSALASTGIALSAAFVLTSCAGAPDSGESVAPAEFEITADSPDPTGPIDSFTWSLPNEPGSLDFAYTNDYAPSTVLANVCDSLFRWDNDLSVSPGLAESYTQVDDTTYVYKLRPDVKFHDGTVMTSADVVASFTRHQDPAVGSYWVSEFLDAQIQATGPLEVTITLPRPNALFNSWLATTAGVVESAQTLATADETYGTPSGGVNCTGPFTLGSWTSGKSITLEKFDDYWDPELTAQAGEVEFVFLPDWTARMNAMTAGEVDGGFGIAPSALSQLSDSDHGDVYFGLNTTTDSVIVTDMEGPLGDTRVRQALLTALDRQGMVDSIYRGYAKTADTLIPDSTWVGYDVDAIEAALPDGYDYDPEAAKKLVEGIDLSGESIVIASYAGFEPFEILAQALVQAAETIGLDATINSVAGDEYGAYFGEPENRKDIDLLPTLWYISSGDGAQFMSTLLPDGFSNYGNWKNDEYVDLYNQMSAQATPEDRQDTVAKMNALLATEIPWLPLETQPSTMFISDRITGPSPAINYLYYPWAAAVGAAGS
ncbi:MAG TPA: ABC transporter substrate-binding protein [Microbacterium sp.]|uniref:ABC transporter substrate-binding protein n=1 Tax=Microbacterium sp. TaxID=51671 RepID=UPI002BE976F6|nr:ABC transporter substrate-binding protein [Microbacterium sp.]HWI30048.1 ABC transporter substrate-binding protein [Microbacterium sp.]